MDNVSEAAAAMGRSRTPKKLAAARENVALARQKLAEDVEAQVRHAEAQRARREREKVEREAAGLAPVVGEKRRPGRPRKVTTAAIGAGLAGELVAGAVVEEKASYGE